MLKTVAEVISYAKLATMNGGILIATHARSSNLERSRAMPNNSYSVEKGIEELVDGDYVCYRVIDSSGDTCATFLADAIPYANAEAEALCAKLNAIRKEQSND